MIKRIWHGYTTPENANAYQQLLDTTVFPGIEAKNIPGYRSIELLRRVVAGLAILDRDFVRLDSQRQAGRAGLDDQGRLGSAAGRAQGTGEHAPHLAGEFLGNDQSQSPYAGEI